MPVPAIRCGKTGITILSLFLALTVSCARFSHELNSLSVSELPGSVEIPSVPFYPQKAYQCGPAAMAMVLQWAKVNVSPQDLIPKVFVPAKKGSLQPALISATRRYNRLAYPIKGVEAEVQHFVKFSYVVSQAFWLRLTTTAMIANFTKPEKLMTTKRNLE